MAVAVALAPPINNARRDSAVSGVSRADSCGWSVSLI
jgi:hypothetical protein